MTEEQNGTIKVVKPMLALFIILWLVTGVIYPLAVYLVGQFLFPEQAYGSLMYDKNGGVIGSKLIGQSFTAEKYFWPRPSATRDHPYNSLASGGSNLGPTNKNLIDGISNRTKYLMNANGASEIPSDLAMASASGLDPHISRSSAQVQAHRVARARGIPAEAVDRMILEHTEKPVLGILGEERVNVLLLNIALDDMQP